MLKLWNSVEIVPARRETRKEFALCQARCSLSLTDFTDYSTMVLGIDFLHANVIAVDIP